MVKTNAACVWVVAKDRVVSRDNTQALSASACSVNGAVELDVAVTCWVEKWTGINCIAQHNCIMVKLVASAWSKDNAVGFNKFAVELDVATQTIGIRVNV